jgi:hypothetical protein
MGKSAWPIPDERKINGMLRMAWKVTDMDQDNLGEVATVKGGVRSDKDFVSGYFIDKMLIEGDQILCGHRAMYLAHPHPDHLPKHPCVRKRTDAKR